MCGARQLSTTPHIVVIGSGPAGLMAAEVASAAGARVTVADAMPSFGRKFLMAGKSGLNLTKDQDGAAFLAAYPDLAAPLRAALHAFGPPEVMAWAEGLSQPIFTGSSGRVFPQAMKASPLLRAWLVRLDGQGVAFQRRWRWTGLSDGTASFETPDGPQSLPADAVVLALGGASWARLGSDGAWASLLSDLGVPLAPFAPANMGFHVDWSDHMAAHFGAPVKTVRLLAGEQSSTGDFVVSSRGIEGSAVYAVSRAVRLGAPLVVDLLPDQQADAIASKLAMRPNRTTLSAHLRKALRLDPVKRALLMEFARPLSPDPSAVAALIKHLPLPHLSPRPIDEAISTAGGIAWSGLTDTLMLRALPGVFVAGEMLDWEAPTGGYLITGCLATGRLAAHGALAFTRTGVA